MKKFFVFLFIASLLSLGALSVFGDTPDFSENENRALMTREKLSHEVFSGALQEDLSSLLSDGFPLRERLLTLRVRVGLALGKSDHNGAYVCPDGRIVQKLTDSDIDLDAIGKYTARINAVSEKAGIPLRILPVPSAEIELKALLPKNAPIYDSDSIMSLIAEKAPDAELVDLRGLMTENDYYRTDHHWTYSGTLKAYKALGGDISLLPEAERITDSFLGSLYSKVLLPDTEPDSIYAIPVSDKLRITADGKSIAMYDAAALSAKDKYTFFEGGNHGIVTVIDPEKKGGVLLILKDSFANSLLPLLCRDYEKIIMLDERYAAADLASIISSEGVTEMLIVKELYAVK